MKRNAVVFDWVCGALGGLFWALKCSGKIGWSWWWVTAPLCIWLILIPIIITVELIADGKRIADGREA